MTLALAPECLDEEGKVRRCRGCPHLGKSPFNGAGCDTYLGRRGAPAAIAAMDAAVNGAPRGAKAVGDGD